MKKEKNNYIEDKERKFALYITIKKIIIINKYK